MIMGIFFVILGILLIGYLAKIQVKKKVISEIGIVLGILCVVYGLILSIQPKEYIQYTKTTISKEDNSSNTK